MKRRKKKKQLTEKQQKRQLLLLMILLEIVVMVGVASAYLEYRARPAALEKIWIADRGGDYITVAWKRVKNVDKYVVTYNGETISVSGRQKQVKIDGLTPDTDYQISVRADSEEREGFEILEEMARTKKLPVIEGPAVLMKFKGRPVDLKQTAEVPVTYTSQDKSVSIDGDKITFSGSGNITVTAETAETEEYAAARKDITVDVLDTVDAPADGAEPHVFYHLNKDNCEFVRNVEGVKEAITPQAFLHYEGGYLVTYIFKDVQKIIQFGDSKTVHTPETDLEHANALTIANGKCYLVRGAGSTRCDTFDPPSSNYSSFELAYAASGIAYDTARDMFYTCSRRSLVVYDGDFNYVKRLGRVNRTDTYYVQDCGAYGGILMQGVSGADVQGVNYIDFYNMEKGTYMGSVECQLNEIESIIVDDEGYIEILSNPPEMTDCIWKTPLNMKMLCE